MAGLYVTLGRPDHARMDAAAARLTFFEETAVISCVEGFSFAWVGHDDPALFGPALDPATGVRVVTCGRVSWEEADWKRAENLLQFEGGLSNRLQLERYLATGPAALERHNGPAALLLWDPRSKVVHLWTDHFGYHPVFLYQPESIEQAIIATFPDVIADDRLAHVTPDETSMAEFLSAWRITPPNTYYREIKHAGAAMHCTWEMPRRTFSKKRYWVPFQEERFPDIESAAEELAFAVREAVRIRTLPRLAPVVCYTSGGMDSRAVLFAAANPADVIGLNLYDVPNKESAISKRLCDTAGVRYVGFARDDDYYPRWLREGARLSGGMWSTEDNHFLGTRALVRELGARTVITACTTDWVFKGYGLEKTHARMFGRNLPINVFTHERINGFLPNIPHAVPDEFRSAVAARLEEHFGGTPTHLKSDADWLAVEDRRIRPACYAVSVSGQIMYRIFPYETFLADPRVADCYSRIRAEWKLNSDVWAKAVQRICATAGDVEDANFGWRIGSSTPRKLATFARGWIQRRINPPALGRSDQLATEGSWPNLAWYARHSRTLKSMWETTPADARDVIARAWGGDPWAIDLSEWSKTPNDLFRIMTLAKHLETRSRPLL